MDFKADLHIHSIYSDGDKTSFQILKIAKEKNISAISITDHDTIDAYTSDFFKEAKSLDIQIVVGVEISSQLKDVSIHILAYDFDLDNREFKDFLQDVRKKRDERNKKILQKLSNKNIYISFQELLDFAKKEGISQTTIGRVHIAKLMVAKGYVNTFERAFLDYIKDGADCFVLGDRFSVKEVIEKIQKAKGLAVLAHPSFIKSKNLIKELLKHEFDGIEVYYGNLHLFEEKKFLQIARDNDLLITAGSDFHGDIKPHLQLASSWLDKENFDKLISKKRL
jgi:3',5'-nucleoside bisphosphate phosphatase